MGKKNKGGRPSKFTDEMLEQAYKLCLLGATDQQIADFFNIAESTLNNWKKSYPDFMESLKNGKIMADAEIAEALFHRAKGYCHTEDKIFQYEGKIVRTETIKHYPPDTAAAFIWLKNRQGWSDKPKGEQGNKDIAETLREIADGLPD